jgi:oligopeptidase B
MTTRLLPLTAAVLAAALSGCGGKPAPDAQAPVAAAPAALPSLGSLADAPVAAKKPYDVVAPHGATRSDEYYWLRDDKREDAEMLAYLNAENAYADTVLKPLEALEETV